MRVRSFLRLVPCVGFLISLSLTLAFAQSDLGTISGFVRIRRARPFRTRRSPSAIKLA